MVTVVFCFSLTSELQNVSNLHECNTNNSSTKKYFIPIFLIHINVEIKSIKSFKNVVAAQSENYCICRGEITSSLV